MSGVCVCMCAHQFWRLVFPNWHPLPTTTPAIRSRQIDRERAEGPGHSQDPPKYRMLEVEVTLPSTDATELSLLSHLAFLDHPAQGGWSPG